MDCPVPAAPQLKPASRKRRRTLLQFSLRGLLLLLAIVAALTAWLNHHYRHYQQEQSYLQQLTVVLSQTAELKSPRQSPDSTLNGMSELLVVAYDYQCKKDGTIDAAATSLTPRWLCRLLGEHFFHRVRSVTINAWDDSDQVDYDEFYREIDLSALDGIEALSELKHLTLLSAKSSTNKYELLDAISGLHNLESFCTNLPIRLNAINGLTQLQKLTIENGEIAVQSASPLTCKLRSLRISWNSNLENLVWCGDLEELVSLELVQCGKLRALTSTSKLSSLETVKVHSCPLKDLRPLNNMPVKNLDITSCEGVCRLFKPRNTESVTLGTESIMNSTAMEVSFPQLEHIKLRGWPSPQRAINLDVLSKSPYLKHARISCWEVKDIQGIASLERLEQVAFVGCRLPKSLDIHASQLKKLELFACDRIQALGGQLPGLTSLKISDCHSLKKISFLSADSVLERVLIEHPSDQLTEIDCLLFAKKLKEFQLVGSGLIDLSCLANAGQLESVNVERSLFVRDLSGLESKSNLKELNLKTLPQLTRFNVSNLASLKSITLSNLPKFIRLDVSNLDSLQEVTLENLRGLAFLNLRNLTSLKKLSLQSIPEVARLDVSTLSSLEQFTLHALQGLVHLEGISNMKFLQKIVIRHVGNLRLSCKLNKLPKLNDASIDESCLPPETLGSLRSAKKLNLQVFRGPYLIANPQ